MIERLKGLNEALPGIILVDLIYLILGEVIIFLIFRANALVYAVGFLGGVAYAVFAIIQLSFRIRKVVYGRADERKTQIVGYLIRFGVMIAVFAVLYIFRIGDLVAAIIGVFAMKVSAYLQPFTHRISSKILKKGG